MPLVVSRWHLVWSKKPLFARKSNEFTVCGAAEAFSAMSIFPQVVARSRVYFADLSMDSAGSFFHVCVLTLPAAALSHGSGALLVGAALGVVCALALALSSSFMTPDV